VTQFSSPVQICLRGTGSLYFISAVDNSLQLLSPAQKDGYLCVDLSTADKLVLADGSPNTAAANPAASDGRRSGDDDGHGLPGHDDQCGTSALNA
jgi:hypothetical protein